MSCSCNKNTTVKEVFESLVDAGQSTRNPTMLGIGLFVIPAPENGILEWKVVAVDNILYRECVKRGSNCESFQWIPKGISVKLNLPGITATIINNIDDLKKLQDFCSRDSCRGGCIMGCFCFVGEAICHE